MPHASIAPPCLTPLARCSPAVPVLHPSPPTTHHFFTSQATSSSTSATSARTRYHACRPPLLYHRCRLRAAVAVFLWEWAASGNHCSSGDSGDTR
ncbi:hypothetical protein I4F81_009700 [Pyropia yezoensis]|uniref:Uncharacterized protein n=1 Tax=Pyropia yezoensis TaxID=2788 RepID=A0ACC3CAK9_PYRYE|nr:hypothetical protein I4F81_009700 [Neopyropia yezoensis]